MWSEPNSDASNCQHLSRAREWSEGVHKEFQNMRRVNAMVRLSNPFSIEELESATTYEELLTVAIKERDELFKVACVCINDISIWDKVGNHLVNNLSEPLLQKVLQAADA